MEENPYAVINSISRQIAASAVPQLLWEGRVSSTDPFVVQAGGIELEQGELFVNASLFSDYEQDCTLTAKGGSLTVGTASGAVSGTVKGRLATAGTSLQEGDRVLLLSLDTQKWYLLCKVVEL